MLAIYVESNIYNEKIYKFSPVLIFIHGIKKKYVFTHRYSLEIWAQNRTRNE